MKVTGNKKEVVVILTVTLILVDLMSIYALYGSVVALETTIYAVMHIVPKMLVVLWNAAFGIACTGIMVVSTAWYCSVVLPEILKKETKMIEFKS